MELAGKRKPRRPKMRFFDAVREDTAVVEVTEEDADKTTKWRWEICCCNPEREHPKKEEEYIYITIYIGTCVARSYASSSDSPFYPISAVSNHLIWKKMKRLFLFRLSMSSCSSSAVNLFFSSS